MSRKIFLLIVFSAASLLFITSCSRPTAETVWGKCNFRVYFFRSAFCSK